MTSTAHIVRRRLARTGVALAVISLGATALTAPARAASAVGYDLWVVAAQDSRIVSVSSTGVPAVGLSGFNGYGTGASMSKDGNRVAFMSQDPNLDSAHGTVAVNPVGYGTVYLHDRSTGATTFEGLTDTGAQVAATSGVFLSGDGRWLAFTACGDGPCALYLRDLAAGSSRLLSPDVETARVSDDGSVVAFRATDSLGLGSPSGIFVWDRATGTTRPVPGSDLAALSGDGRHVAVTEPDQSLASYDLVASTTQTVSLAVDGTTPLPSGAIASMTYDGRFVVFESGAAGLVDLPGLAGCDPGACGHVYRRDMTAGTTVLVDQPDGVSDGSGSGPTYSYGQTLAISADGSRVGFASKRDLIPGVVLPQYLSNVYVRDIATDRTRLAASQIDGSGFVGFSGETVSMTADGRSVAFVGQRVSENEWPEVFVVSDSAPSAADADGVPDAVEAGAPNGGDGNHDGTPDSAQANVSSQPVAGSTTGAYVTVAAPAGTTLSSVQTVDPATLSTQPPAGTVLPSGLLSFALYGISTEDVTISVYGGSTAGITDYAKYDPTSGTWSLLPSDRVTVYADHVDIRLTDGGEGDADHRLNHAIVDPGGISGIDTTPPVITTSIPATTPTYVLGAVPVATCTATDAFSGMAGGCHGTTTGGNASGVGTFTYTASATDRAGNTATMTASYRVIYAWHGVDQPINDPARQPGQLVSVFKAASTVPVSFTLTDAAGRTVQPVTAPAWITPTRGGAVSSPIDESVYTVTGDSGAVFRQSGSGWKFNWKTDKTQAGSYWRIGVTLDDGQTYYVNLGLR